MIRTLEVFWYLDKGTASSFYVDICPQELLCLTICIRVICFYQLGLRVSRSHNTYKSNISIPSL